MLRNVVIFLSLLLATACQSATEPTPEATITITPSSSPTLKPTATPTPFELPWNPAGRLNIDNVYSIELVGLSSHYEIVGPALFFELDEADVFLGFVLMSFEEFGQDAAERYFARISTNFTELDLAQPEQREYNGLLFEITALSGVLAGTEQEGVFGLHRTPDGVLMLVGFGAIEGGINHWQLTGQFALAQMLGRLQVGQDEALSQACTISSEPSYGYTVGNPIQVGSRGAWDGPSRERAYLDSLRGPNGEPLSYERRGSTPEGDTILDIYLISSVAFAEPRELYIDMYTFSMLYAPQGFSCGGDFTISAP